MRTGFPCNGVLLTIALGFALGGASCAGPRGEAGGGGVATVEPDVVYGHKAGLALTFDVYHPRDRNGAAILLINSGGFESGKVRQCRETADGHWVFVPAESLMLEPEGFHYPPLEQFAFADLLADGYTVFDIRHGCGSSFRLDAIVSDVRRAVRFIRLRADRFAIDPERMGVWGASAGGYLALLLGVAADAGNAASIDPVERTSDRVASVVAYYPAGYDFVGDAERFPELIANLPALQVPTAMLDSLSLEHHVSADDPPTLVVYGAADLPFIVEPSQAIIAALEQKGVDAKSVVLPGVGHEFRQGKVYVPDAGERAMSELRAWFREHL